VISAAVRSRRLRLGCRALDCSLGTWRTPRAGLKEISPSSTAQDSRTDRAALLLRIVVGDAPRSTAARPRAGRCHRRRWLLQAGRAHEARSASQVARDAGFRASQLETEARLQVEHQARHDDIFGRILVRRIADAASHPCRIPAWCAHDHQLPPHFRRVKF
jgi:hypothetical protein